MLVLVAPLAISQNAAAQSNHIERQNVFEDDRVRVAIPAGWSIQTTTAHVSGDKSFELPIGVLVTKHKYKIYLLTHQEQASGIQGGRFAEVVQYVSPWIDMTESPWLPCPFEVQDSEVVGDGKLTRHDLYFDTVHASAKALLDCGNPKAKGMLWYGSYFIEKCQSTDTPRACGSFFLTYQDLSGKPPQPRTVNGSRTTDEWQMVYAISFDTMSPDTLPMRDNPELQGVLREASGIVRGIVYK